MYKINKGNIIIQNNYANILVYIPIIWEDDYEDDVGIYGIISLIGFNAEQEEMLADLFFDLPKELSLEQLKDFVVYNYANLAYSIIEKGYLEDVTYTSLSYKNLPQNSLFYTLLKDLLGCETYAIKEHIEYSKYLASLISRDYSIFPSKISRGLKQQILVRDNFTCQHCGKKYQPSKLQVHHKRPKSQFGSNRSSNLETVCQDCHKEQHIKEANHQDIVPYLKSNKLTKCILNKIKLKTLVPDIQLFIPPDKYRVFIG